MTPSGLEEIDLWKGLEAQAKNSGFQEFRGEAAMLPAISFKTLLRHKWLILLCLIGVLIPFLLLALLSPSVYEAKAVIMHKQPSDRMFEPDRETSGYKTRTLKNLTTQLKSRYLAKNVARALPTQIVQNFKLPEPLPEGLTRTKYISNILEKTLKVKAVSGSDILEIRQQANHAVDAKIIANTYVEQLIEWNLESNREEVSSLRDFVESQLAIFRERQKISDEALRESQQNNKRVSLGDASAEVLKRLTEAEAAYNELKTERWGLQRRHQFITKKIKELSTFAKISGSTLAKSLKEQLVVLESRSVAEQHDASEAEMAILKEEITRVKGDLTQELLKSAREDNLIDPFSQMRDLLQESNNLEAEIVSYTAKVKALSSVIAEYEAELEKLPGQELQLARIIRARDVNDRIYSMLLEKREQVRIAEASKGAEIQIVDAAETPLLPVKPAKKKIVALGLFLGFAVGAGLALFLEARDTSLLSEEDIENVLRLPVLASIPTIKANRTVRTSEEKLGVSKDYSGKTFRNFESHSYVHEAYAGMQLNLAMMTERMSLKANSSSSSLLITSSGGEEGKTLTAINMAGVSAYSGVKTLLIDCDLRRPGIHKFFNVEKEPGLNELLRSDSNGSISGALLDRHVRKSAHENLFFLTSGSLPPNPPQILMSKWTMLQKLLARVRDEYELVILDAPPLLPVMDPIVLGRLVNGVCFVVRSGFTDRQAALRAKKTLEKFGISIVGAIVNDVDLSRVYGYHKYFHYYLSEAD